MESILALLLALAMVPFQPGGGEWGYGEGTLRNEWVEVQGKELWRCQESPGL